MGVLVLLSAKGSPGTTTTALLTAAVWPRPVLLVDCDPAGGDVAMRLPDPAGHPLDPSHGLLSLLPLARRPLAGSALLEHAQLVSGGIPVVTGVTAPEQAVAGGPLWENLATAFAELPGSDVIVDAGRADAQSVHLPVLRRADVVACVVRPTVAGVFHAREYLRGLGPELRGPDGSGPRIGLVVVAPLDRREVLDEVLAAVRPGWPAVEAFGHVALDPKGAPLFEGGPVSRPERTLLVRSGRELAARLEPLVPHGPVHAVLPAAPAPDPVAVPASEPAPEREPVPEPDLAPAPLPPPEPAPDPVPVAVPDPGPAAQPPVTPAAGYGIQGTPDPLSANGFDEAPPWTPPPGLRVAVPAAASGDPADRTPAEPASRARRLLGRPRRRPGEPS